MQRSLGIAVLLWLSSVVLVHGADSEPGEVVQTATIARGQLSALFRDNSESPKVLSGIDALFNLHEAQDFDAFDPDGRGASAGLNFEHIISGHRNESNA